MAKILIKNADIITVNSAKDILNNTDILIEDNKISKIESNIEAQADEIINAKGKVILPGFVQTHIHLCQTMFRGLAENRELLNWLRERIWPLEAAHNESSAYYSAMMGIGELVSSGTTTILDMGGVHYTDKIFEAVSKSGIRAMAGKAMMDSGEAVPEKLLENMDNSISESMNLYNKWNNAENGRIKYAFAPRFILSVSDNLFYQIKELSDKYIIPVHTHAYENRSEGQEVIKLRGMREFEYFEKIGILNERFLAAHCIWMDNNDIQIAKERNIKILHCPSSNFKLGSGTLNLATLLKENLNISIGADGAACNNNLDMLHEIRTTALLQNVLNKPGTIKAHKYLELATIEGAKALGLDKEIGSIEEGKKADLIIMNLNNDFHSWHPDPVDLPTRIVFASKSSDIETVIIDGKIILNNKRLTTIDQTEIIENCKIESEYLLQRAQLD